MYWKTYLRRIEWCKTVLRLYWKPYLRKTECWYYPPVSYLVVSVKLVKIMKLQFKLMFDLPVGNPNRWWRTINVDISRWRMMTSSCNICTSKIKYTVDNKIKTKVYFRSIVITKQKWILEGQQITYPQPLRGGTRLD